VSVPLKQTITLFLLSPRQTVREVFLHTAFLNVDTFRLKPTDSVVVKQTKVSVDVVGIDATPTVAVSSFSSLQGMTHPLVDEIVDPVKRR
jgi:hypothetical protein